MGGAVQAGRGGVNGADALSELKGRRILVTGASSGIGAAVAAQFGVLGAHVAVHYNSNRDGAEATVAAIAAGGGKGRAFQADLAERGAAARLVKDAVGVLGGLDLLVNNAGDMLQRRPTEEITDADLDRTVDVNIRPTVLACTAALGHLRASKGSIINVTSISAHNGGTMGSNLYAATKGFLSTYTRGLARELAAEKLRVNGVAPGVIATPLHARRTPPEMYEKFPAAIPLGRIGLPDDCVGAFVFLACESLSGYMTGQIIEVNGGQYMA